MKQHRQVTSQSERLKTKGKIKLLLYTSLSFTVSLFTRRLTVQKTFAKRGIS